MKNVYLILFLLLVNSCFSQFGPPREKFIHHYEFNGKIKSFTEKKYQVNYEINTITRKGDAVETHFYEFDRKGNYIYGKSSSFMNFSVENYHIIDYEAKKIKFYQTELFKHDPDTILSAAFSFKDSTFLLPIEIIDYSFCKCSQKYEYDSNNRTLLETQVSLENTEEVTLFSNQYDAKGNCIEEKITRPDKTTFTQKNEYDSRNFLIKKTYFDNDTIGNYILYENDSAGNCIKEKYYDKGILSVTEISKYDSAGREIFYHRTAKTHPVFHQYRETFDQHGNQTSSKHYNPDGTLNYWSKSVFKYDEKGNITEEVYWEKDYPKYITEFTYEYY